MDRVFELIDEKYDIEDAPDSIECKNVKGHIVFDHVDFSYHEKDEAVY